LGNIWVAAFVGFIVTVVLTLVGLVFIGHLIGGSVAGLIARGGMSSGALAGFLSGIFGGIIIAIIAIVGLGIAGICWVDFGAALQAY